MKRVVAVRITPQIFTEFILFTRISPSTGHTVVNKTYIRVSPYPHEALFLWIIILTNNYNHIRCVRNWVIYERVMRVAWSSLGCGRRPLKTKGFKVRLVTSVRVSEVIRDKDENIPSRKYLQKSLKKGGGASSGNWKTIVAVAKYAKKNDWRFWIEF